MTEIPFLDFRVPYYPTLLPRYGRFSLYDLSRKATELCWETEILSVREDLREGAILCLDKRNLEDKLSFISENGLIFLPVYNSQKSNNFSHIKNIVQSGDSPYDLPVVIAKDLETALELKKITLDPIGGESKHTEIGKILGYPECCIKEFLSYLKYNTDKCLTYSNFDPIYEISKNGSRSNWNPDLFVHLRYFGFRIIPWFPCEFECAESSAISEKYISIMESIDKDATDRVRSILRKPCSWSTLNCQAEVRHEDFLGYASSYYSSDLIKVEFS